MEIYNRGLPHLFTDWSEIMPTYEYSCNECGTYGSVHRTYKEDDGGMLCPKCGLNMARMYSAPGIILKGTGWGSKP